MFHKGNERNYFQMTLDLESYVYYVIGNIYGITRIVSLKYGSWRHTDHTVEVNNMIQHRKIRF